MKCERFMYTVEELHFLSICAIIIIIMISCQKNVFDYCVCDFMMIEDCLLSLLKIQKVDVEIIWNRKKDLYWNLWISN